MPNTRRGRPPINPERRLSLSVTTRVTDTQYLGILRRARQLGITGDLVTQYLRRLIDQDIAKLSNHEHTESPNDHR